MSLSKPANQFPNTLSPNAVPVQSPLHQQLAYPHSLSNTSPMLMYDQYPMYAMNSLSPYQQLQQSQMQFVPTYPLWNNQPYHNLSNQHTLPISNQKIDKTPIIPSQTSQSATEQEPVSSIKSEHNDNSTK